MNSQQQMLQQQLQSMKDEALRTNNVKTDSEIELERLKQALKTKDEMLANFI
jgi:hypothetical protein